MGAQEPGRAVLALLHEEGVVGVARGVIGGEVQRGEVMKIIFHVRAFSDGKAHIGEDDGQFFHHLAHRVQRAFRLARGRQGDVHAL